jgi:hypothetical protein
LFGECRISCLMLKHVEDKTVSNFCGVVKKEGPLFVGGLVRKVVCCDQPSEVCRGGGNKGKR